MILAITGAVQKVLFLMKCDFLGLLVFKGQSVKAKHHTSGTKRLKLRTTDFLDSPTTIYCHLCNLLQHCRMNLLKKS